LPNVPSYVQLKHATRFAGRVEFTRHFEQTQRPHQRKDAIRHRAFYRPVKQQVTARLDSDVLRWLKSQGKGYQSRMNEILRKEMLAAMKR
jgi:uncharacterized protein (DUF4415 family)